MVRRLGLLAVSLFILVPAAFAQCPSNADAAQPTSPSGSNFNAGSNITFSWTPSTVAGVTYDVYAWQNINSPQLICANQTGSNCTSTFNTTGQWTWGLKTKKSNCTDVSSNFKQFTVGCLTSSPAIQSPSNGATNVPTNVTLTWNGVSGADSYDIYIGPTANGACGINGQLASSNTTTFTPPALAAGTQYGWRVVARKANCPDTTSSCGTFTTAAAACTAPGAFDLRSPNNVTLGATPALFWNGANNGSKYIVHIGTTNPPTPSANDPVTTNTSYNVTTPLAPGTYYWNVDAYPSCSTTLSTRSTSTYSFTVRSCPTGSATLTSPASGASIPSSTPVTFNWTSVASAQSYDVFLSTDNGATFTNIGSTQGLTKSLPAGSYVWYVRTNFDAGCPFANSQALRFTVTDASSCPANPAAPVITSPADGATNLTSPVTLQWTSVSGAKAYVVLGSYNGGNNVALGVSTTNQLTVSLPAGTISWVVEAKFGDDCPSTVSQRASFTITAGKSCTSNAAPALVSPANGATNVQNPITFDWNDVSGANAYNLYLVVNGSPVLAGNTTDSKLERTAPKGTTGWLVEALFTGCDPVRSAISNFTLAADTSCDGLTISRTAPADGATVTAPVTFKWTLVPNATIYRLWLAMDGGAAEIVARTTDTQAVVSVPSGTASWYVEALLANCPAVLSSTGKFTVPRANNCDGHTAPALVSPTANLTADKVNFQWNAAPGAIAYRLWLAVNTQPFAEIALTKDTSVERELPAATYGWFVEALYDNCPPVASARASFVLENTTARCANGAPALVAPADKAANVTSPVTFLWSAVANAVEYRLYVSYNGAAPKLVVTTPDTSVTEPVPTGNYAWYVEAVFRNCPATQSPTSTFTVPRAQNCSSDKPQLVSPANGAQNLNSPVTLSWNPLSGAIGYIVFAKHGDGAAAPIGQTGADTTLSRNFPDGRIEWWVVALIAGCDPAESAHFTFTVVTQNGCDHRKPITLAPDQNDRDVLSPVHFAWTPVAGAIGYNVWIQQGTDQPTVVASTTEAKVIADVPPGVTKWFVEAKFNGCPSTTSAISAFNVLKTPPPCRPPDKPVARVVGQVQSGATFTVRWTPLVNVGHFELQQSTTADFANPTTFTVSDFAKQFSYEVTTATQYLYRVRGISSCSDDVGPWSDVAGVFVMPLGVDPKSAKSSTEAGAQGNVVQTIALPGLPTATPFNATVDKPWLTVTPASGTIGPDGVTLTVTAAPGTLNLGTNTGTVTVTYGAVGKTGSLATSKTTVPISVSVVTPVSPVPRNTPQQDSLIIPGVAHANGANNSLFQSDVRVANVSSQTMKYLVNFTPIATDGTQSGSSTTIEIEPGATTALDDILSSFFGTTGSSGTLEIRPQTTSSSTLGVNTVTVASSRTYNVSTTGGTLGQFIPAIPYANFIAKPAGALTTILSLQQLANSAAYRTNIGLVEASGQAASVMMRVFDDKNALLAEIPVNLRAGEYLQDNYFAKNGISFTDGRVEIQVTSSTGRVTAYASTIDNATNDPLLVQPVLKSSVSASHYVLPGIAALNTGAANWRSDVRIYNAGSTDATATLKYIPMPNNLAADHDVTVTLKAGEVAAFDDILKSQFGVAGDSGGALSINTTSPSSLITSARTYNLTSTGTLGQFIPGVTSVDAVGTGERSLQILQLEQSDRYRTNIGLAETNGQPATVEVSLVLPDSKVSAVYTVPLEANQFVQFPMTVFNAGTVYNGRVSLKVISGSGRVTAYGSVIDAITGDPTLVPSL